MQEEKPWFRINRLTLIVEPPGENCESSQKTVASCLAPHRIVPLLEEKPGDCCHVEIIQTVTIINHQLFVTVARCLEDLLEGRFFQPLMGEPEHLPPESTTRSCQGFLLVLLHPDHHLLHGGGITHGRKNEKAEKVRDRCHSAVSPLLLISCPVWVTHQLKNLKLHMQGYLPTT